RPRPWRSSGRMGSLPLVQPPRAWWRGPTTVFSCAVPSSATGTVTPLPASCGTTSMAETPLHIASVSIADRCGGAEKMAWDLFQSYRERGHRSWPVVGEKQSDDPDVFALSNRPRGVWFRFWRGIHHRLQALEDRWPGRGAGRLVPLAWDLAQPGKWYDRIQGYDDFRFPATYRFFDLIPRKPDVVHC